MYPDTEFLPRAPDPEDIVLEGEETGPVFGEGDQPSNEPAPAVETAVEAETAGGGTPAPVTEVNLSDRISFASF